MKKYSNGTIASLGDNTLCMTDSGIIRQGVLTEFLPPGDGCEAVVTFADGLRQPVLVGNCIRADEAGVC